MLVQHRRRPARASGLIDMKKAESWLFPVASVIAVLVILIAVNVCGDFLKFRVDLTENKLYTL